MIGSTSLKIITRQQGQLGLTLAVILLAGLAIWLPLPPALQLTAAGLLAFFLPGWWLLRAVGPTALDRLEQLVLACGLSYSLTILSTLALLYVTGALAGGWLWLILGLMSLGLAVISWRQPIEAAQPLPLRELAFFLLPLLVAAFFSFTNLGYADYWGDEMNGLLRAVAIIGGRPETLFEHTKGPVEVLLPAAFGLLAGRFEPFTLRFPFALAHILGVAGFFLLARRMLGQNIAWPAALLLALNGLYLAFGRMIQYQAVVFLMTSLSLLLGYHFYQRGGGKILIFSSLLVGVGLLAHYDMLLALPPLAYLVWQRYRQPGQAWRSEWRGLIGAGLILLAIVASFYLPFLLRPQFASTSSYLNRIIGPANWPVNNFDELYIFAVLYNSAYYVAFIAALGLGQIISTLVELRRGRNRWLWGTIGAGLVLGLLAALTGQANFVPLLAFIWLFALLVIFPVSSTELKMIYLWIGVSFVGYVFFVDHPRTHLQIIYPGWSLLAAVAAGRLVAGLQGKVSNVYRRGVRLGIAAIGLILLLIFAGYEYLLFVDTQREYIFTYPQYKSTFYWEDLRFPFSSRRLYGAPHRLGWQMINSLYAQNKLQGDWNSNDDGSNLFWYTLGSPRNPCYPRYYFLTQFVQNEDAAADAPPLDLTDYTAIGQVWNNDRLQMAVYEFAPAQPPPAEATWREPAHYSVAIVPADFRTLPYAEAAPVISTPLPDSPRFRLSPPALQQIAATYGDPRIEEVRDTVALVGYDLDDRQARPGGLIMLTLYWRAETAMNLSYKIFAHLEGEMASLRAQSDEFPACGARLTQHWPIGEIIADRHLLRLPADIPPGDAYTVRVGLYEPQTGLRLDRLDALDNPQGVSFDLVQITVLQGSK